MERADLTLLITDSETLFAGKEIIYLLEAALVFKYKRYLVNTGLFLELPSPEYDTLIAGDRN